MSDGLTPRVAERSGSRTEPRSTRGLRRLIEPLVVLVAFAGAGAGAGWLWERWWTPISGVVVEGTWLAGYRPVGDTFVFEFPSLQGFFDATAQYVVIGVVGGLVLGVLGSLLGRCSELVMLVAVVGGSALASFIAYRLGTHLGPIDPVLLQSEAANGTSLPSNLSIEGASPFVAWPLGALVGLSLTYLLTASRAESQPPSEGDVEWLDRPTWLDEGSTDSRPGTAPS